MRRPWQYALLGAAVAFFVLYGIELASDGVEDVYGPEKPRTERRAPAGMDGYGYVGDPYPPDARGRMQADPRGLRPEDAGADPAGADRMPAWDDYGTPPYGADGLPIWDDYGAGGYGYSDAASGGSAGRLADGTAGLLQSVAKGGIRFIVSLFESVAR